MHMYAARKIAWKTSEKTLNLKGEMCFATETSLAAMRCFLANPISECPKSHRKPVAKLFTLKHEFSSGLLTRSNEPALEYLSERPYSAAK
jgi:hypothetical protein